MKGTILIDRKIELKLSSQFFSEPISRFFEGSSSEEPYWEKLGELK